MYGLVYDTKLTIEEVLTRLAEQPKGIAALTAGLARTRLHDPPSRGEWSLNDVLAHLRSCSDMWGEYIATIIAEDRPTIRAMNPTTWIRTVMEYARWLANHERSHLKHIARSVTPRSTARPGRIRR
jgi:hypothetical protein